MLYIAVTAYLIMLVPHQALGALVPILLTGLYVVCIHTRFAFRLRAACALWLMRYAHVLLSCLFYHRAREAAVQCIIACTFGVNPTWRRVTSCYILSFAS